MIDVYFIHYDEARADEYFKTLKQQIPTAQQISGIRGVRNAYSQACQQSQSDYFFIVDGDNEVSSQFSGEWIENYKLKPTLFWAVNEFGFAYGHGAIKLLHKRQFLKVPERPFLDWTDMLFRGKYVVDPTVLSRHDLGRDFQRWRTIFREIAKLTLRRNPILQDWLKFGEPQRIYTEVCEFLRQRSPQKIFSDLTDYGTLKEIYENRHLFNL